MNVMIQFLCCICHIIVEQNDSDRYSLWVQKFDAKSPEVMWAHGPCLRDVIPVVGVEIPNSSSDSE